MKLFKELQNNANMAVIYILNPKSDAEYKSTGCMPESDCFVEIAQLPKHNRYGFYREVINRYDRYIEDVEKTPSYSHIERIRKETPDRIVIIVKRN